MELKSEGNWISGITWKLTVKTGVVIGLLKFGVVSSGDSGWLRGSVVERRFLAGVLSLSCAQHVADG